MTRPRVLLDVDGVIADFTGYYLQIAGRVVGREFSYDDVTEWSIARSIGLTTREREIVEREISESSTALYLDELPGAVEGVKRLAEVAEIYFVTSPWDTSRTWPVDRRDWLVERFGDLGDRVVHTRHKELVVGEMLVDDKPENVIGWADAHPGRFPVLWTHPANRYFTPDRWMIRSSSWDDLIGLVSS